MIFSADTAIHCPAEQWVPAMLEGAAPKSTETAAAQHRRTGSWRTRVIGANVAMALNSCPNLPLTQGAGPEGAVFRRVDWLDKGAVNRSLEATAALVAATPRRWVNSSFASSMSTQPFEAGDLISCLPPQARPKIAGSKCAGEGFSYWLENVSEQL